MVIGVMEKAVRSELSRLNPAEREGILATSALYLARLLDSDPGQRVTVQAVRLLRLLAQDLSLLRSDEPVIDLDRLQAALERLGRGN